jgi:chemotaxis protein MotB
MTAHYSAVGEDEEGYFASMTDVVIGLLFIFIIMLMFFAMRFQEATQKQDVVTEKQNTLIEDLTDAESARSNILQNIGTYLQSQGINVIIVKDEGILRFPEDILFDKSSWELKKSGASNALNSLARALDLVLPCYTSGPLSREQGCPKTKAKVEAIFIEGNADSDVFHPSQPGPAQPRSPSAPPQQNVPQSALLRLLTPSTSQNEQAPSPKVNTPRALLPPRAVPPKDNLDLSALRATSTFRELISAQPQLSQYLSPENGPVLGVSGYGEYRPLVKDPNETLDQWKQRNRRIDIRILMATPRSEDAIHMQQDIERNAIRP